MECAMDDKKGEGCVDLVKEICYDLYWISKWLLTTTLDNKQHNSCGIVMRVFFFSFFIVMLDKVWGGAIFGVCARVGAYLGVLIFGKSVFFYFWRHWRKTTIKNNEKLFHWQGKCDKSVFVPCGLGRLRPRPA